MKNFIHFILILVLSIGAQCAMGQSNNADEFRGLMENIQTEFEEMMGRIRGAVQNMLSEKSPDAIEPNGNDHRSNVVVEESFEVGLSFDEIPVRWPVMGYSRVSSPYGYRTDPFTRKRSFHHGIDIPMPINTPIYATAIGVVEKTGYNRRSGWYIIIKHKKHKTVFAHLNRIVVKEGSQLGPGTLIGYSGNTGRSTGPHLHYQISTLEGSTINPLSFIHQNQNF
jgi:murein DD-endopeptidase MepM/ murein hydrolase activator NlpD